MSRNTVILIVALIFVALILILAWRSSAQAQDIEPPRVHELLQTSLQNLSAYGVEPKYTLIGTVTDVDTVVSLLSKDTEFFLIYSDGKLRPTSLSELPDPGQASEELYSTFTAVISPGDLIYSIALAGREAHMTVSNDATRFAGLFPFASRLPVASYYPNQQTNGQRACNHKVLSRDIFGRDAETISVCTQAVCLANGPSACELADVITTYGFFGFVTYEPPNFPAPGKVMATYCRGGVRYKWGVRIGTFSLGKLGKFGAENFGLGGTGATTSEVQCTR